MSTHKRGGLSEGIIGAFCRSLCRVYFLMGSTQRCEYCDRYIECEKLAKKAINSTSLWKTKQSASKNKKV